LCNFCLPGSGKDADPREGRMRTPVDSQAMQRNTKSVLLGEPANRAANACHGKAEGIKDSDGGRISACLRTFCRLALRFGWGRSEDRVCCLWLCRRMLRATVARACPVATARPCRCCCKTYDVHVPKIGQGTRNLRPKSTRCAAEVAAGASFLDRHVSNGPRTHAMQAIRCTARMTPRAWAVHSWPLYAGDRARETRAGCPTLHRTRAQLSFQ
jgi:hypothetical protein